MRKAALMALALLAAPTARSEETRVTIDNFTFDPPSLTVAPGTTVTWTNKDDAPHTVTATGNTFRSKALDTDDAFSFTFSVPGTYEYFCSLHPHMKATIVVGTAPKASP